ncbi:pathogenesis-related protein 1C-like [Aristolochia californica]|uniref:pathogenesis-related protein 1C-like n=1 Tax=Aristolochia californica TaxID=171875 RepID=UPI0035E28313
MKNATAIVCLFGLAIVPIFVAADLKDEFLDLHNKFREEAGVAPLEWDDKLAAYARDYANKRASDCQQLHSNGPYGENIYWGYGDGFTSPNAAIRWWLKEKNHLVSETNKCADGKLCTNYKQLASSETKRVGCARVTCGDGNTFMICNYEPKISS